MAAAIFKNRLPVTSDSIQNGAIELLDPENEGLAVEISILGVTEAEIHCCIYFMNVKVFITGLAAAILVFQVGVELRKMCHFVAPSYLGKVTKAFLLTPSGLEMAVKRSVWGVILPPQ